MRVLIIGASGLVGGHCLLQFRQAGYEVIGTHLNYATPETVYFNAENIGKDISEKFNIHVFNPQIIIHCGALTNVDYCEQHPDESEKGTLDPTKHIVEYCKGKKIKLIYISTDYVFDGINGPYVESDSVNPVNIYGKHKLACEQIVSELPDFIISRITNVYGEELRSKNFIARLIQMFQNNEDKTLHLPVDQFATPVYAGDIARMLVLLVNDNKKGIYNLSSTDYYNRYQLAMKVKSYFKDNTSVILKRIDTQTLKQPAQRPLFGGLLPIKISLEYPEFISTNVDSFIQRNLSL